MTKKQLNIRVEESILKKLEELSIQTGKTKTQLIEDAIQLLYTQENQNNSQLEVLSKQNEQLQLALSSLKTIIDEKEKSFKELKQTFSMIIQEKENTIKEKDARIKDLQEMIETLKNIQKSNKKKWWNFWK